MYQGSPQPIASFFASWFSGRLLPAHLLPKQRLPQADRITPLMVVVERIVTRHAAAAMPMPSNPVLGELSGGLKRQSAARALNRLEAAGRIKIERDGFRRRVKVLSTGSTTGWGDSRPGHAPFCTNPRGTIPPHRERAPESRPLAPGQGAEGWRIPWTPPSMVGHRTVLTGAAPTCQYPMWADGQRATGLYCGDPATTRSFCSTHDALCYPGKR